MENEILYKQLRNLPVCENRAFLKWVKAKYPDKDTHHLTGSQTGIKLNDYLVLPVTREEHLKAEANKQDFAVENLAKSLRILFEYLNGVGE